MSEKTYTCAICGETYEYEWSDEEALAEFKAKYGDVPEEERDVICDDCYQPFEKWRLANA